MDRKMEFKNKRGKRASENQKEYLVRYLEQRPNLANDKFTTAEEIYSRDKEWTRLSLKLNSLRGTVKNGQKWRKYWKDLIINVRSRESAIKEKRRKRGVNGFLPIKVLSVIDKRIIAIITPPKAVEEVSTSVSEMDIEIKVEVKEEDDVESEVFSDTRGEDTNATAESFEASVAPFPPTAKTSKRKPPRRTLTDATDEALAIWMEFEDKRMKIEERKIALMEESNRINRDISNKLDMLIVASKE